MLDLVGSVGQRTRHSSKIIKGFYLEVPLGERAFDCAISLMTLHYLVPHQKVDLYFRVHASLLPGGVYVARGYVVEPAEKARLLAAYYKAIRTEQPGAPHSATSMSPPA